MTRREKLALLKQLIKECGAIKNNPLVPSDVRVLAAGVALLALCVGEDVEADVDREDGDG